MIDIHNHIIPNIDDGCKTIEESIICIEEMYKLGISSMVCTPHYVKGSKYNKNNKEKEKCLSLLKKEVKKRKLDINLYLGNEVYYEDNMLELLNDGTITTLNNSRYLLFELPMTSEVHNLGNIIFELRRNGIIPVIAHCERYTWFQKKPNDLIPLIEQGALIQGNLTSISGGYGKEAKKCIKELLKNNLIHVIATDIHHSNSLNFKLFNDSQMRIAKLVGGNTATELMYSTPEKIINNEDIDIKEPIKVKKKIFSF